MGNSFGDRLRHERLARSLTQAELGGQLYSASYISLLENGRREPTVDVIKQLAKQLQLAPHSIEEWALPISPEETQYLLASLYARQAWDTRDYLAAQRYAADAARKASDNRDPVSWWNMVYLQANALVKSGAYAECIEVLGALLAHPLSTESAGLSVRARQVLSTALMGEGRLPDAIREATIAVEMGAGNPDEFDAYTTALRTLIGALAESGKLEEAWQHCLRLADAVTKSTPAQLAGEIHWVIGNVAFMRHDVAAGLTHHAQAGNLLSPATDLAQWAHFNKATAWVRLTAGIVEPATLEAIERCELAQSVIGATIADQLEVKLLRARWYYLNGALDDALALLEEIGGQQEHLASNIAGDAALLLGKTYKARGRLEEAMDAFTAAREHFTTAGATDRVALALDNILELRASGLSRSHGSAPGTPA
ncbi:helix-turn-helix domain-containing protein [Specibacter cremeus]|uniref:helix-turn-helix domain-containing protein n=1 Tax=Specibacter cremeus TaxID=1629051 RepID=UPI000F7873A2|nr:helix-turn-helix transcriptional regulator [Specibacter cremeus]